MREEIVAGVLRGEMPGIHQLAAGLFWDGRKERIHEKHESHEKGWAEARASKRKTPSRRAGWGFDEGLQDRGLPAAAQEQEHAYTTEKGSGGLGDGGEDDFIETNSARIAAVGDELKSDIP